MNVFEKWEEWETLAPAKLPPVLPVEAEKEAEPELKLRPATLSEYIGQSKIAGNLSVFLRAARERVEALDHLLLTGPPGLGKTTLANIVARELGVNIKVTSGPMIEGPEDFTKILATLAWRDVLFVDEIHRLEPAVEEALYPAMEDFRIDTASGVSVELMPFTLIGATTRPGLLSQPLLGRFGINFRLNFYPPEDLARIILRSAGILKLKVSPDAALEIGKRARGTPRIANRILRRLRDFAQDAKRYEIDLAAAQAGLELLEVDEHGLDDIDRRIILTLIRDFGGGPAGVNAIAASVGEDRGTLEDVHEPFLIQSGLLKRTPRGRMVSEAARKKYGREAA